MAFAEKTDVPVERSKAQIEVMVEKAGAEEYVTGKMSNTALVQFKLRGRFIRFLLPLPQRDKYGSESQFAQEMRRVWRALHLTIKAKLESYESGIEGFDEAFLAQLITRSGDTVYESMSGTMARILADEDTAPRLRLSGPSA